MDLKRGELETLQHLLHQLELQERQWRLALEDYAGTPYAQTAAEMLQKLPTEKAAVKRQIDDLLTATD